EDCGLVLAAISGADPADPSSVDAAFAWPTRRSLKGLRVGYLAKAFEAERPPSPRPDSVPQSRENDLAALAALRAAGATLVPVALPELPLGSMLLVLGAEAAAAFDDLVREGKDDVLVKQGQESWANVFRQSR